MGIAFSSNQPDAGGMTKLLDGLNQLRKAVQNTSLAAVGGIIKAIQAQFLSTVIAMQSVSTSPKPSYTPTPLTSLIQIPTTS